MPEPPSRQRIDLAPASQVRSRPVRTGGHFLLVLPVRRLVSAAWEKSVYKAGDEAKLVVSGRQVQAPLQVAIERQEGSSWRAVGTAQAKVSADATQATATFRFPARVDGVFAGGRLTKAGWDHSEAKPGEALDIRVEAEGMDGQPVLYEVEREEDGGWVTVARWDGRIDKGKAESRYQLPGPGEDAPRAGALISGQFEDGESFAAAGEITWASVRATGLDGTVLQFEIQRETPTGEWQAVGSGAATVRSGLARAALPLLLEHEDPRRGGGAVLSVQLEGELRPAREGSVVAHARGMDRQTLGISVEVAGEDGSWREVASAKAIVRDGLARAELDLPPAKPG